MRVHALAGLRPAADVTASRVVVYDRFNNPLAIVIEHRDGLVVAELAGSPGFIDLAVSLGLPVPAVSAVTLRDGDFIH